MTGPKSTKPYLIRALYEWCVDSGYTPYISVLADAATRVPPEYVKNGEIVLNVGPLATSRLRIGDEAIEFSARFGGVAREIRIPVERVAAIYARENGQGMTFEVPSAAPEAAHRDPEAAAGSAPAATPAATPEAPPEDAGPPKPPKTPRSGRPALRRIK